MKRLLLLLILTVLILDISAQDSPGPLHGWKRVKAGTKYIDIRPDMNDTSIIEFNDTIAIFHVGDSMFLKDITGTYSLNKLYEGGGNYVEINGSPAGTGVAQFVSANSIEELSDIYYDDGLDEFVIEATLRVIDDDGLIVEDGDENNMLVINDVGTYTEALIDVDSIFFQLNNENGGMVFWADNSNNGDTCWLVLIPHGSGDGWIADTATVTFSDWATHYHNIGSFYDFYFNRGPNDEWNWSHIKDSVNYNFNALDAPNQLRVAIEKNFVWDFCQRILFLIFIITFSTLIIMQQIRIKNLEKHI